VLEACCTADDDVSSAACSPLLGTSFIFVDSVTVEDDRADWAPAVVQEVEAAPIEVELV
jgi:hypothetical protein